MLSLSAAIIVLAAGLAIWTNAKAREIEARFPAIGEMIDVGGYSACTPSIYRGRTVLICHRLCSFMAPAAICAIRWCRFGQCSQGRAEMLFIDRPGHGWSERGGPANQTPDGQAAAIARAMQAKGISRP
jgi:hypothetical protein